MYTGTTVITPFEKKLYLASPTMHGEELVYINRAYETNWMSTLGENIDESERLIERRTGRKHAVALTTGTAAMHLAVKAAGITRGTKVFCSDLTFAASTNPVVYEGGIPVFIDAETSTWNMDPASLALAFQKYTDVRHVVVVNLFGTPCRYEAIRAVCEKHSAVIIEDAAEALGASYFNKPAGTLGDISVISFNGNKIITGTSGGMLLTDDDTLAAKVRKWSTQSREDAPWYQHNELGYNYRMSNLVAGVIRGQMNHLDEHITRKKAIYDKYQKGLSDLPVQMNPFDEALMSPNYWLSCMTLNPEAMCEQHRGKLKPSYVPTHGKSCPSEILETLKRFNAEGRPLWKPMHLQPLYASNDFISAEDDNSADLFRRGLCLPSDINMTEEQQERLIAIVRACFE